MAGGPLSKDYRRRVRARLLELGDPLCQRWDNLWLRRLGPWSPPSHLPHTCHLCGECDTVSSAAPTGANRCTQCSQVAACPWPEPPAAPHRRTEEEALHRCIGGAHAPSHERAGPAGAALLWIHVQLRDPTSVAHLLHVFAPCPPPAAALYRARSTMPRLRGDGPEHTRARRRAQEAAVRGLVAGAVTEAHEAHAAAQRDRMGSARAFLSEAALPAVRALNGAGAPTLLLAMHRIVNAARPGLISPEAALYGHWMEWRTSNRSGRPLSMGDTLRLTGAGSAMSLHSSAPALLHAPRTRCPRDTAPYLNQARATYAGGVSKLDAAPHLLHLPAEDVEVGKVTVFVEGADEAPTCPRPTNPVYDGTRPTPPNAVVCEAFPREPAWCPTLPPATHASPRLSQPAPIPPPLQDQQCPPQRARPLARAPGHPPAPPRCRDPWGPGAGPGDHPHPPVRGRARTPPPLPAPAARDGVHTFVQTQEVTAVTGVHLVRLPSARPDNPRGPRALSPAPDWELWRDVRAAWLTHLPAHCRWMAAGPRPHGDNATAGPPSPPPPPCGALHSTAHGTTQIHREVM